MSSEYVSAISKTETPISSSQSVSVVSDDQQIAQKIKKHSKTSKHMFNDKMI